MSVNETTAAGGAAPGGVCVCTASRKRQRSVSSTPSAPKPAPVIVTSVPPSAPPLSGSIDASVGCVYTRIAWAAVKVPSAPPLSDSAIDTSPTDANAGSVTPTAVGEK